MCAKTYQSYTCGCVKLHTLTFCPHIDDAEHLIRDNGMHHYGDVRQLDIAVYLKSVHDSHAPDDVVSVDGDEDEENRITRFVEERYRELSASCERDTVVCMRAVEGECKVCAEWGLPEGVVHVGRERGRMPGGTGGEGVR
jgi:hypothetical protein